MTKKTITCGDCKHFWNPIGEDYVCMRKIPLRFTWKERRSGLRSWLGRSCGPQARFFELPNEPGVRT